MDTNEQRNAIKFKINLSKKDLPDLPGIGGTPLKIRVSNGLYKQPQKSKKTYSLGNISLTDMKKVLEDYYNKTDKNEYRKKFNIRSEVFKQTYKF